MTDMFWDCVRFELDQRKVTIDGQLTRDQLLRIASQMSRGCDADNDNYARLLLKQMLERIDWEVRGPMRATSFSDDDTVKKAPLERARDMLRAYWQDRSGQ